MTFVVCMDVCWPDIGCHTMIMNMHLFIYSAIYESQVTTDIAEENWNLRQTQWVYNFIKALVTKTKEESQGLATHSRIQNLSNLPLRRRSKMCIQHTMESHDSETKHDLHRNWHSRLIGLYFLISFYWQYSKSAKNSVVKEAWEKAAEEGCLQSIRVFTLCTRHWKRLRIGGMWKGRSLKVASKASASSRLYHFSHSKKL